MQIKYPSAHKWIEEVNQRPDSELGKNNQARLKSTINKVTDSSVSYNVEVLDQTILDWFTPLYTKTIVDKDNPKVFDIYGTTIGKDSPYTYYALVLYEENEPIGATIFSERKNLLSIAYRIYPNSWQKNKLQANPSIYSEYLLNEYAWSRNCKTISHGRDRNPYGLNAHIGLGIFKLSVGCKVYLPTTPFEVLTLDLDEIETDILLMKCPEDGKQITEAILYCIEENFDKYSQITKYPDRLNVEVIYR